MMLSHLFQVTQLTAVQVQTYMCLTVKLVPFVYTMRSLNKMRVFETISILKSVIRRFQFLFYLERPIERCEPLTEGLIVFQENQASCIKIQRRKGAFVGKRIVTVRYDGFLNEQGDRGEEQHRHWPGDVKQSSELYHQELLGPRATSQVQKGSCLITDQEQRCCKASSKGDSAIWTLVFDL